MHLDARGLPVSIASAEAAAAYDYLVTGYLTYRADTPARLNALLEADPDFALGHCMQGYFAMLGFKRAIVPLAVQAARSAESLAAGATPRERSHIAALTAWADGELDRAIATWESILRTHPHDVVAFRLAHFVNFWLGRPQDMVASVERVIPAWSEDIPGYSTILACRCFAQEEAGNYLGAEPSGRRAIELDPGDLWAAHAVAHVMEMQGRRSEGIEWLTMLAPNWEGSHNLQHHLWWHCALFELEHGDHATALELYDSRFRNLAAPLTVASPDVYIDVQNAASMLFRLQRLGVDVGNRWEELADKAEARIGVDGHSAVLTYLFTEVEARARLREHGARANAPAYRRADSGDDGSENVQDTHIRQGDVTHHHLDNAQAMIRRSSTGSTTPPPGSPRRSSSRSSP